MTWEEVFRYRDGLHAFLEDTGKYLDAQGNEPRLGSRAADEILEYSELECPRTVYAQASLLLDCIADHAFAMIKTLNSPGQTIAPWTCARAMLEASAIACWLMDTSIGTLERIERSMILRKEGLHEQRKALASLNDHDKIPSIYQRLEGLEVTAAQLGFAPLKRMPSFTDLSRDFLQDESSYRIFSAMLHGHAWALTQLGFHPVDPSIPRVLEKNIEPWTAALLVYKAAHYFAKPVWCLSVLYAYDTVGLKNILNSSYDSMGVDIESEFRFWRE